MSEIQRVRAPRADGSVLAVPPLADVGRLLAANRTCIAACGLAGESLTDLRRQARQEILAEATAYLRQADEPLPSLQTSGLLLTGHQPELFHPGVWVKNFALAGLARQHGLTAVNLVVDNDTAKSASLRLPARHDGHVRLETVPFDHWTGDEPYEELRVRDEALFADFVDRAGAVLRPWGFSSMLPAFWHEVLRQGQRTPLIGERFAAARRAFERRWGCHNLEVPVSRLCRTESFATFACHLLAELPRFHDLYNRTVQDHRRRHGIRSKNHPVPDLAIHGDWREVPFWGWRAGRKQRGRLLVRLTPNQAELRSGDDAWPSIPLGERSTSVRAWRALEQDGFKIRPRALSLTMFARLLVGELFIHGIGGGKYDELTDAIMQRFYGIEPPAFAILTATLLLPLPFQPATVRDRHTLRRAVRDLHYNPQQYLSRSGLAERDGAAQRLVAEKTQWIERQPADRRERRERFRTLRMLNERMWPYVSASEREAIGQLVRVDEQLEANAVLERRDFAFCLFPEAKLRDFFTPFLD